MIAKLIKLAETPSKFGGSFYYAFFKDEHGDSYKSCITKQCRNYSKWSEIISNFNEEQGVWLNGLTVKEKGLVDADSEPFICLSPTEEAKQQKLEF